MHPTYLRSELKYPINLIFENDHIFASDDDVGTGHANCQNTDNTSGCTKI